MRSPLNKRNGELYFENCSCNALAEIYGTPLYLVSENFIQARLEEIRRDFLDKYPGTSTAYASKAFQTVDMCRLVAANGMGMDVVSGGELHTAIKAGADPASLYFHGNAKSDGELTEALRTGVGRIVVDNFDELLALEKLAGQHGYKGEMRSPVPILFRITPGVDSHTHSHIATGNIDSKFGIPLEKKELHRYMRKAVSSTRIDLKGFHFHVGSQLMENDSHLMALQILVDMMAELKKDLGFITAEVNLGGGFGVQYTQADCPPELKVFTDAMMETLIKNCRKKKLKMPTATIEPGRWIIAEAGATLYTVCSVKTIPGIKTWVAVDGGMGDNLRPALYDAAYTAEIVGKADRPGDTPCDIAGKYCESGDVLIRNASLPSPQRGDLLAVYSTGAYGFSMYSTYNRTCRPAVVAVNDGSHRISVRRQSYDDLTAQEN